MSTGSEDPPNLGSSRDFFPRVLSLVLIRGSCLNLKFTSKGGRYLSFWYRTSVEVWEGRRCLFGRHVLGSLWWITLLCPLVPNLVSNDRLVVVSGKREVRRHKIPIFTRLTFLVVLSFLVSLVCDRPQTSRGDPTHKQETNDPYPNRSPGPYPAV